MRPAPLHWRRGKTPPPAHRSPHRCMPRRSLEQGTPKARLCGGAGQLPTRPLQVSEHHGAQSLGRG